MLLCVIPWQKPFFCWYTERHELLIRQRKMSKQINNNSSVWWKSAIILRLISLMKHETKRNGSWIRASIRLPPKQKSTKSASRVCLTRDEIKRRIWRHLRAQATLHGPEQVLACPRVAKYSSGCPCSSCLLSERQVLGVYWCHWRQHAMLS